MFYQVSTETMEEVESLLGEMNKEAFQTTMSDLWTSVQELAKDPSSSVTQSLFVQRAEEFIERSVNIYEGLSSYQDNTNQQIKQQVDKINEYGKQILALNDAIRAIEVGGVEHANDLRDTRNLILDELAQMVDISYTENAYAHPGLIGTGYFQWCDQDLTGRRDGENYNCGLIDVTDRPYKEQVEAIAVCYINSYANESHERRTVEKIKELWPEVRRFDYPHNYYVDLSDELLAIKTGLLNARR